MESIDWNGLRGKFLIVCRDARSLSSNTICAYDQDLSSFQAFLASYNCAAAAGVDIQKYVQFLRERGSSAATVRRRVACLKVFFRWAQIEGLVPRSPFADAPINIRIPRRLPRSLSRQQVSSIANAVSPMPGAEADGRSVIDPRRTTHLAIWLMLATGIRVGELTAIRLTEIAMDSGAIRIHGKGSRERTVYITNTNMRDVVRRYAQAWQRYSFPDDFLLRNVQGRPLTPQALRMRLRKLGLALEISQPVTPHRFRHTAATTLLEEGVDIRFVRHWSLPPGGAKPRAL